MLQNEIHLLAKHLIDKRLINPEILAHDRSLLKAKGEPWHKKERELGIIPNRPCDKEANWGYSETKKEWIYGYGIHLTSVVTPNYPVFPIFVELTTANIKGTGILKDNLDKIPDRTKHILADTEFESQDLYNKSNKRMLTPIRETINHWTGKKAMSAQRRKRKEFFKSPKAQKLYKLRNPFIEQLFNISKNIFNIEPSWFFGKRYTETLVFLSIYAYQIFVVYSIYHNLPLRRIQKIKPFLDRL